MGTVTPEQMQKLYAARDAVKGTTDYTKYEMATEYKSGGRWKFLGHSVPTSNHDAVIKTIRGKTYLYVEDAFDVTRYEVTDAVREVLGL